jgi:hypothetical protein
MRASFVSFVQNRYLLADLAYAMLDCGQVKAASEAKIRSIVSTLLADPDKSYGFAVDEFLQRVYATELLSLKDDVVQWRSARTQAYLAALRLNREYRNISLRDEQKAYLLNLCSESLSSETTHTADVWLCEKAELIQWHDPIALMSYYVRDGEESSRIAELLVTTAPSVATHYHQCLKDV